MKVIKTCYIFPAGETSVASRMIYSRLHLFSTYFSSDFGFSPIFSHRYTCKPNNVLKPVISILKCFVLLIDLNWQHYSKL